MAIKFLSFIFLTILALTQKSWSMEEVEDRPLGLQIYTLGSQKPVITVAIRPSTTILQIKEKIAEYTNRQELYEEVLTADNIILKYRTGADRAGATIHGPLDTLAFKDSGGESAHWIYGVKKAKRRGTGKTDEAVEHLVIPSSSDGSVTVTVKPSTTLFQIKEKIAEEIIKQRGLQKGALTGDDIVLPYRDDDKTLGELTRNGLKGYLTYIVRKAVKSSADTPAS